MVEGTERESGRSAGEQKMKKEERRRWKKSQTETGEKRSERPRERVGTREGV